MGLGTRAKSKAFAAPTADAVVLVGTVQRIIHQNGPDFAIFRMQLDEATLASEVAAPPQHKDEVQESLKDGTVVVRASNPGPLTTGMRLKAEGAWDYARGYGWQLTAQFIVPDAKPATLIAAAFLQVHVPGIGPIRAQMLADHYGEELPTLLGNADALRNVHGIGPALAKAVAEKWNNLTPHDLADLELAGYGVGKGARFKLLAKFGTRAAEVVKANPWEACKVRGLGFAAADALAKRFGVPLDCPVRDQACLLECLADAAQNEGSVRVSEAKSIAAAADKGIPRDRATAARDLLVVEELVVRIVNDNGTVELAPAWLDRMEKAVASHLRRLMATWQPLGEPIVPPPDEGFTLVVDQEAAVRGVQVSGVAVVAGGPGTGKTTILRTACDAFETQSEKTPILCCAPTGRAADRMSRATGRQGSTIHRLLGFRGDSWTVGRANPLPRCILVVDELSMVDVALMYRLLEALQDGSGLVLVGDPDQLPSVGPGAVLRDVLASCALPTYRLKTIMRQAAGNPVIAQCHAVNRGAMPRPEANEHGVVKLLTAKGSGSAVVDPEDVSAGVLATVAWLRDTKGVGMRDMQVLCLGHKTAGGAKELNRALHRLWLPKESDPDNQRLVEGALVLQTKNDYDNGVMNGTQGIVQEVTTTGPGGRVVGATVLWDGRDDPVEHTNTTLGSINPAWAMSVHKAQGSEWPWVVVAVHRGMGFPLLKREVLYTAMSRARKGVVLVGPQRDIQVAAQIPAGNNRRTGLRQYLEDKGNV